MNLLTSYLLDKTTSARKDITVLLVLFGFAFFQFLGRVPLIDPDEGRYAEIPREMLERGDFITPLLNYVKYFEKPPLHYWLNAISFRIFGENEFAARFPGTLCGLLTVLLVYCVGRMLFGRREGLAAALILGSSAGFLVQARIDLTDMTLTFCMSACLGFFLLASREDEPRKRLYYYLFYVFSALAVLAKGLIGLVLPGGVIFLYLLLGKRWRLLREMRLCSGILLFLLVAAPWFVLVSMKNAEFARFFFIHEHFERFLTKVHGRYQPIWFFIPVLLGTFLPWSFFIPAALKKFWQERKREGADERLYLVIWAVFIFAFFSKSSSKLVPYILPVFPPLALLIGCAFTRALEGPFKPLKVQAWLVASVLAILGIGLPLYPHLARKPELGVFGSAIVGAIFLGGGAISALAAARGSAAQLLIGLCLFSFTLEVVAPPFFLAGVAEKKSHKRLALIAARNAGPDTVLASFGLRQGLSFYTKQRVVIVGSPNELEFGSNQGDQSAWFLDYPAFLRLWEGGRPVIVLMNEHDRTELMKKSSIPARELGNQGKKVLLTNR